MSCSNSIFSSITSEKRWVAEMCYTFTVEHVADIDLDTPCCVFRAPKSLSEAKPEAYAPQQLGLGPYHHLRPDLYTMQRKKLAAVIKFLNAEQQLHNIQLVFDHLLQREYLIPASYDEYLDFDPSTLAWILAIDTIYLARFFKNRFASFRASSSGSTEPEKDPALIADILMLENQIPVTFLLEVRRILKLSSGDEDDRVFCESLCSFCRYESPLEFDRRQHDILNMMRQGNPLKVMYHMIVTNRMLPEAELVLKVGEFSIDEFFDNLSEGEEVASSLGLLSAGVHKHVSLIKKVPWKRILALFKKGGDPPNEQNALVEEIDIPSVSELHEIAGIEFGIAAGGIRDVEFDEEEKKFYLPVITLKSNSEIVLRNLLAYEAATAKPGSTLELAEYVDLMCGIVDTPKDVEILRSAGIIKGGLKDAEIATIFNGIRKSTGEGDEKTTNIEKAIDQVKEKYDNTARVKVARFIKKYVYRSWKFLTLLSAVVVVLLLTLQAFCEIYGCNKRWFK